MSSNLQFRVCSKGCKVFTQGVLVLYREPQLRGRDEGLRQIDFYPQYEHPCYQVYKEFSDLSLVPLLYRNITFKNCAIIFKYGTLIIQTFLLSHVCFKKALGKLRPALLPSAIQRGESLRRSQWDPHSLRITWGGGLLEIQTLRPHPDLLNQDLHFNKLPRGF